MKHEAPTADTNKALVGSGPMQFWINENPAPGNPIVYLPLGALAETRLQITLRPIEELTSAETRLQITLRPIEEPTSADMTVETRESKKQD